MTNPESYPGHSFPRSSRLLSTEDYQSVFQRCKRLSNTSWTLLIHRKRNPCPRLGLAVSKKRARRAVDRNRLKRIARESFRVHKDLLVGKDLIVLNRDGAAQVDSKVLRSGLDKLIQHAAKL